MSHWLLILASKVIRKKGCKQTLLILSQVFFNSGENNK